MSETLIGKTKEDAKIITDTYLNMLTNKEFDRNIDLEEAIVYGGRITGGQLNQMCFYCLESIWRNIRRKGVNNYE